MDSWKQSFLEKLGKAQSQWVHDFEEALEGKFVPVHQEYEPFLADNGFKLSSPLHEPDRRSYKFELSENAYLLMIFRASGVGEFELRCESFAPGHEPMLTKTVARAGDLDEDWAKRQLQSALDAFVDVLSEDVAEPVAEFVEG